MVGLFLGSHSIMILVICQLVSSEMENPSEIGDGLLYQLTKFVWFTDSLAIINHH